jgi:sugar O-acyltransferase (sialic acid O-acetyltransferase NeuD family)
MSTAKRVIIVGAGGFGREMLQWTTDAIAGSDWQIHGFLDANPDSLTRFGVVHRVLADPTSYEPCPDDVFVCAVGNPLVKRDVVGRLLSRGAKFITVVHPTAIVGARALVGEGCILCPGAVLTADVKIGQFVTVNAHATVGHDVEIGDWATLSGHADVTGGAVLGEGVFAGSHACVLPKVKVGAWASIGAGSAVVRRVRAGATVFGVPAREIGLRATGEENTSAG